MLEEKTKEQIRTSFASLKVNMPNFKVRHAQNKMIATISQVLSQEKTDKNPILCVEAPTGVGKTIAYLLSAIPIALANKKKLIIASANIALQEQLINKDIADIQKYCTFDFTYTLIKGRSRYVCIRNLTNINNEAARSNPLFHKDGVLKKQQLAELNTMQQNYNNQTWNGDVDNLSKTPAHHLWQKIACNRFTCSHKNCEFYQDCAFFKIRKHNSNANVIVANHDLVLTDLSTGNNLLPAIEDAIIIFDEAHHLPKKALSHFTLSTSIEHIKNTIKQITNLSKQVIKINTKNIIIKNPKLINNYLKDLTTLFEGLNFADNTYIFEQGIIDKNIKLICKNILISINSLNDEFQELKKIWSDYIETWKINQITNELITNATGECTQHLSIILSLLNSLQLIDKKGEMPHSNWIKKSTLTNNKINYHLNNAKIDVSADLKNLIWSKVSGAVITSATLSSLGNFTRLNQQLGLTQNENTYLHLSSPFNYNKINFIIANFKNDPSQTHEHTQEVASELLKRININKSTLVLFASNKQMQIVANMITKKLDCNLLLQGRHSKKEIIQQHIMLIKNGKGSVIFGLDSFSEGIDLKGNNLSHVIIIKLRFSVPNSPIEQTIHKHLLSQNRNSFIEVSLPDASLKLIQASGRLMRSETDTGKITIFDKRLITKFYGKKLLNALPNYNIIIEKNGN